ncbi:hypothetical protein [Lysobacter claricitrinus]|uniref:hypothetical protein n=1 Tax=Lysobacter claricitrinus TaxID=3367728 RepID=UPI0037DADFBD
MADNSRIETLWTCVGGVVVALGLALRATLMLRYPTIPVSDFLRVVDFATMLSRDFGAPTWHWLLLSPGTSTLLGVILRVVPGDPVAVARTATMLLMSALPLLPLVVLRGVVPTWARVLVAALIALQPAQVIFSGVVAQDNWVQLPVLALACIGVRNAFGAKRGFAASASVLWVLSGYIRQEMWLAAFPLVLLAVFPWGEPREWRRRAYVFGGIGAILLSLVAWQRHAATDRFALTTAHGGAAMLGSYMPGAGFGWLQYDAFVAAKHPELQDDTQKLMAVAGPMAWNEIKRRPGFHLQRRVGALFASSVNADGTLVYWSLLDEAQKPSRRADALLLAQRLGPWVLAGLCLLHAAFFAAVAVAVRTRNRAVLAIAAAIALKAALHVLFATQARFMLVANTLEALAVGLAAVDVAHAKVSRAWALTAAAVSATAVFAVVHVLPRWEAAVKAADPAMHIDTFLLRLEHARASCSLASGVLVDSAASTFRFKVAHPDPAPGERAEVRCLVRAAGGADASILLGVEDAYAPGGFPDRLRQEVRIGGNNVLSHDISAEAGAGWWETPLSLSATRDTEIIFRIQAVRPDAGPAWGEAATTRVRLREPTP